MQRKSSLSSFTQQTADTVGAEIEKVIFGFDVTGMALCLAGCNIGHYVVTQYTGNEITNTLHATDYSVGYRLVTLTLKGSGQVTEAIPGTFVLEPETPIAATSAGKIEYSARLIGVGKDLRQWNIEKFHIGDDSMVRLTLPGHSDNEILINGTMILERMNRVFGNVGSRVIALHFSTKLIASSRSGKFPPTVSTMALSLSLRLVAPTVTSSFGATTNLKSSNLSN